MNRRRVGRQWEGTLIELWIGFPILTAQNIPKSVSGVKQKKGPGRETEALRDAGCQSQQVD